MNIAKFNSWSPSKSIFEDLFDNFLQEDFGKEITNSIKFTQPMVNIIEEKDKFQLELAIPGITKDDISIDVEKDQLIISSEMEQVDKEESKNYSRKEFFYGSFRKSFHLPETVNREDINAKFENGILSIDLKKKEEAIDNGPKHIEIK